MEENKTTETTTSETFMDTLKRKFSSRKFIMSIVGVVVGICGIIGCNDNTAAVIAFVVLEALSILGYCLIEGHVDASAVKAGTELLNDIVELVGKLKADEEVTIPEDRPSENLPLNEGVEGSTETTEKKT